MPRAPIRVPEASAGQRAPLLPTVYNFPAGSRQMPSPMWIGASTGLIIGAGTGEPNGGPGGWEVDGTGVSIVPNPHRFWLHRDTHASEGTGVTAHIH